jgi:hypothetical protein
MVQQPDHARLIAGALGVAVASAALIGFVVSRPQTPTAPVTPTPLTQVVAPMGPPATAGYSVADDLATKEVVVFGGIADNQATWLWNGDWSLAQPQNSPPGRIDAAAAYDPDLHLVLLFGGHGPPGTDLHDTWAWGGANWRELDHGTASSPPSDAEMAWDPALHQMLLVAGAPTGPSDGTWIWSGTRWTPLTSVLPFPASRVSLAFDPSARELLAAALPMADAPTGQHTQTWAWDGATWHDITTSGAPVAKTVVGLGLDPSNAQLLLFTDGTSNGHPVETWVRDGTRWRQSSTNGDAILSGVIVNSASLLLLVGALDLGAGVPATIRVWSWVEGTWAPA